MNKGAALQITVMKFIQLQLFWLEHIVNRLMSESSSHHVALVINSRPQGQKVVCVKQPDIVLSKFSLHLDVFGTEMD